MSAEIERFDDKARQKFNRLGHTVVRRGELLRHPLYTRFLHWSAAIFFLLALLSGMAIYSPSLFPFLTSLFGGGAMTRFLHPWFSLAFTFIFIFQFLNWLALMVWNKSDNRFMRNIKKYATNREKLAPEDTEFFNGGQKLYFWLIALSAVLFLVTGILMWFDDVVSRLLVAVSYVLHDIASLFMLGGFLIHVYQATIGEPGTFRSMINGTVSKKWAWTHHPAWYRKVTGRNPREDYERARHQPAQSPRLFETDETEIQERAE